MSKKGSETKELFFDLTMHDEDNTLLKDVEEARFGKQDIKEEVNEEQSIVEEATQTSEENVIEADTTTFSKTMNLESTLTIDIDLVKEAMNEKNISNPVKEKETMVQTDVVRVDEEKTLKRPTEIEQMSFEENLQQTSPFIDLKPIEEKITNVIAPNEITTVESLHSIEDVIDFEPVVKDSATDSSHEEIMPDVIAEETSRSESRVETSIEEFVHLEQVPEFSIEEVARTESPIVIEENATKDARTESEIEEIDVLEHTYEPVSILEEIEQEMTGIDEKQITDIEEPINEEIIQEDTSLNSLLDRLAKITELEVSEIVSKNDNEKVHEEAQKIRNKMNLSESVEEKQDIEKKSDETAEIITNTEEEEIDEALLKKNVIVTQTLKQDIESINKNPIIIESLEAIEGLIEDVSKLTNKITDNEATSTITSASQNEEIKVNEEKMADEHAAEIFKSTTSDFEITDKVENNQVMNEMTEPEEPSMTVQLDEQLITEDEVLLTEIIEKVDSGTLSDMNAPLYSKPLEEVEGDFNNSDTSLGEILENEKGVVEESDLFETVAARHEINKPEQFIATKEENSVERPNLTSEPAFNKVSAAVAEVKEKTAKELFEEQNKSEYTRSRKALEVSVNEAIDFQQIPAMNFVSVAIEEEKDVSKELSESEVKMETYIFNQKTQSEEENVIIDVDMLQNELIFTNELVNDSFCEEVEKNITETEALDVETIHPLEKTEDDNEEKNLVLQSSVTTEILEVVDLTDTKEFILSEQRTLEIPQNDLTIEELSNRKEDEQKLSNDDNHTAHRYTILLKLLISVILLLLPQVLILLLKNDTNTYNQTPTMFEEIIGSPYIYIVIVLIIAILFIPSFSKKNKRK